jgi:hypothetical protein
MGLQRLASRQRAVAPLSREIFFAKKHRPDQQCLSRVGMDARHQQLGRAHFVRTPRVKPRTRKRVAVGIKQTPRARRSASLRSYVPWRRLELRQSERVRRGRRTIGWSNRVGAACIATSRRSRGKSRQSRVAGEQCGQRAGGDFHRAGTDLPQSLRPIAPGGTITAVAAGRRLSAQYAKRRLNLHRPQRKTAVISAHPRHGTEPCVKSRWSHRSSVHPPA